MACRSISLSLDMEVEEAKDMERMRKELVKSIGSNWEDVIKIYEQYPGAHTMSIGQSGDTALHVAVASGREDIVERLVKLIYERSEDPFDVLSIGGYQLETPLHLAASLGSIPMCKCILGVGAGDDNHKRQQQQLLLGARNDIEATPMYMAVYHAKNDTFLWLYERCRNSAQALLYCRANHNITVLHIAIANGYWDLAFQIMLRLEGLMDSVNDFGNSPLLVLAQNAVVFRSGISLNIFENFLYNCIYVEDLIPDPTFKEEKMVESMVKRKKQLDVENVEEGQGHHYSSTSSRADQGSRDFPTIYDRCFNFLGLTLSKLVHRSITIGKSEIRTLKGIKETHIWSTQIMNKLLEHAVRSEYGDQMNPRNDAINEANCYSEYNVFRRGKAFQTPILCAAVTGVIEMVEKMLQLFPMTIHDRDKNGMNVVLLAVKYRQSHIYDFLLKRRGYVVDKDLAFHQRDFNNNTILHLAAMQENLNNMHISMLQLQWGVKWYQYVKNSLPPNFYVGRNDQESKPTQIFIGTHEKLLTKSKEWLNNICNSCSVIAALISTLAFASSSTVPGGVNQDTGDPIFQDHLAFKLFAISSLLALSTSFTSLLIFFSILMSKHEYRDFIKSLPRHLILALTSLFISMVGMLLCFFSGHFLMLDDHLKYGAVPVYALTFLAIIYFSVKRFPSYSGLISNTFSKVPQRHFIFQQDIFS